MMELTLLENKELFGKREEKGASQMQNDEKRKIEKYDVNENMEEWTKWDVRDKDNFEVIIVLTESDI